MNVQKLLNCKWRQKCYNGQGVREYMVNYYVFYEREGHVQNPEYDIINIPDYGDWRFITGHNDELDDVIKKGLENWFNQFNDIEFLGVFPKETNVLWELNEDKEKALISNTAYGWDNYRLTLINSTDNTYKRLHTRVHFTDRELIAEQVAPKFPHYITIAATADKFNSIIESPFLTRQEVETILDRNRNIQ
ncbi:hypothetical protein [Parvicella tangerina]|uniref:Uncharacterized protein n=1 Tax=Parvicella tangerina TaxID=2829795 RepID=A0A916NF38_9FLAO|nr:hypothetical protein [Parvicella tangerina]CAG5077583.1 hypothetical protein CRYO30217_00432 [Parvicella tangerina]